MAVLFQDQSMTFQDAMHGAHRDPLGLRMLLSQQVLQLGSSPIRPTLAQCHHRLFDLRRRALRTVSRPPAPIHLLAGSSRPIPLHPGIAGLTADPELPTDLGKLLLFTAG